MFTPTELDENAAADMDSSASVLGSAVFCYRHICRVAVRIPKITCGCLSKTNYPSQYVVVLLVLFRTKVEKVTFPKQHTSNYCGKSIVEDTIPHFKYTKIAKAKTKQNKTKMTRRINELCLKQPSSINAVNWLSLNESPRFERTHG